MPLSNGDRRTYTAALLISGTIALGAGSLLWWITVPGTVRARDVFSAVGWTWLVVTLVGAVPYLLGGTFDAGIDRSGQFVNAIFGRHPATALLAPPASPTSSIPAAA